MQVICIEDEAFYKLVEQVATRLLAEQPNKMDKWVTEETAMDLLKIKSKTTLQKWRDEGRIRYTQPEKKIILYDTDSINDFLDRHAKNTF